MLLAARQFPWPGGLAPGELHFGQCITPGLKGARAAAIERQLTAERAMVHAIIRDIIVALPFAIAVLVGMMALALSDKQPWYAWVGLGTVMGVYAAGFFGTIAGVMLSEHLDEAAMHEPADELR